jgi:hypothetical protein
MGVEGLPSCPFAHLPVHLPQIYPGTPLKLGRLWLRLQSHATDPRTKPNN